MINKEEFKKIGEELKDYDSSREQLIKKARDVLKTSKRLIYSVHRANLKEADNLFKEAAREKEAIDSLTKKDKSLVHEGSYIDALEEYAEAMLYYSFVKKKKIISRKEIGVGTEAYLRGMCDFTGELARKAVSLAVKRQFDDVDEIKRVVEDIYDEFLKFDLRNGMLRKKSDSIKHNLKRIEEIVYDSRKK